MEVLSIHRIHLVCAPVITLCVSVVPLVLSLVYICIAIPFSVRLCPVLACCSVRLQ